MESILNTMHKYNKYNIGLANSLPFGAGLWSKRFVYKW